MPTWGYVLGILIWIVIGIFWLALWVNRHREKANAQYREIIRPLITEESVPYQGAFSDLPVTYPPIRSRVVRGKNKHEPEPECETPETPIENTDPPDEYDHLLWKVLWEDRLIKADEQEDIDALVEEAVAHGYQRTHVIFLLRQKGKIAS